jgi:hypothetical protein
MQLSAVAETQLEVWHTELPRIRLALKSTGLKFSPATVMLKPPEGLPMVTPAAVVVGASKEKPDQPYPTGVETAVS